MKNCVPIVILSLLATFAYAEIITAIEAPKFCLQCGMDRTMFAHSRMLVAFVDGTTTGVCSLHCATVEIQKNEQKRVSLLKVADYAIHTLIDARTAVWVVGGDKSGVMTSEAKWAFARLEDAQRFVKNHGGMIRSFDQALSAATKEVMAQIAEELAVESELKRELR
jgi:nitrous oxide reductase accessory protein NosL